MSLIALKKHLMQVKIASLASLCAIFAVEQETMRCYLSHWIKKGCVRKCTKTPDCGSKCFKCQIVTTELYEWMNNGAFSL